MRPFLLRTLRSALVAGVAVALLLVGCSPPAAPPEQAPPQVGTTADVTEPGGQAPAQEPSESPQRKPRRQAATATVPPEPAATAAGLARQILAAEQAVRDRSVGGRTLAEAGYRQQAAYRQLADTPRWDRKVLSRLPHVLRPIVRANVAAQRELSSMSSGPPPKTLPEWRIIPPAPRHELRRYYRQAERRFGVPWYYLAAIHLVETRMGRIRGTSTADAKGPMQFIPSTWASYGRGDIWDNRDAILAAGRYLRSRGAPGDMDRAVYSYNNDVRYVRAVTAYALQMRSDPAAYRGYYHWQVYYRQKGGAVWLPVGYDGRD